MKSRHRMSRRGSRRQFTKHATRSHMFNSGVNFVKRGGVRL